MSEPAIADHALSAATAQAPAMAWRREPNPLSLALETTIAEPQATVTVTVGSVAHPMMAEHFIQWIYLQTEHGGQRKALKPGDEPKAVFKLADDKPVAAFAYCNLHGLWKADI